MQARIGMRDAHVFGLRPVDEMAQYPAAVAAMRVHALLAGRTFAARRDTRDQDAIAGSKSRHPGADLFDDADAFVAEYASGFAARHVAFKNMEVGTANRRLRYLDDRIGRLEYRRTRPFVERLLAGAVIHERLHRLHGHRAGRTRSDFSCRHVTALSDGG
jgi:hypothetical protein